jgi:hypothetical protein
MGEMPRDPLDDATTNRLLAGALDPEDAPQGYAKVAALLQSAQRSETRPVVVGRSAAVSTIAAAIRSAPVVSLNPTRRGRPHRIAKLLTWKALGIALPIMALTGGSAAAAATGSLPGPAQSAVSGALAHMGVSVPSGNAVGPNVSGPAKFGLCTAAQANDGHASTHSVAFSNLEKAAAASSETTQQYCAGVIPPSKGTSGPNDSSGSPGSGGPSGPSGPGGSNHSNSSHGSSHPNGSDGSSDSNGSDGSSDSNVTTTQPDSTPDGVPSSHPGNKS